MSRATAAFLPLWTAAILATTSAFVLDLALRGRSVQLGYQVGAARQEQARLREVKRVLELEAASYKTPERVEIVARSLLGMESPPPERIISLASVPPADERLDVAFSGAIPSRAHDGHDERPGAVPP
jgi:cell division protein FtsL